MSYACLYMLSFWSKFTNCHLDLLWSLLSVSGAGGLLPFLPSGRWPSSTALRAGSTLGTFASSYALISLLTPKKKQFNWHVLPTLVCLCVKAYFHFFVIAKLLQCEEIPLNWAIYKYVQIHSLLSWSSMLWHSTEEASDLFHNSLQIIVCQAFGLEME